MKFLILERRKKFLDYFKPRKRAVVTCRRTIGQVIGIGGGYKTKVECLDEIAESGEMRRIIERLAQAARQRNAKTPFSLPRDIDPDYRILALCRNSREARDSGLLYEYENSLE